MKAFITGGTGFIGSHLADNLIKDPRVEEVRCLVRSDEKWLKGKQYTKIAGDLDDLSVLKKGMEGVDVVFHIAGVVKASSWKTFQQVNVDGSENILRTTQKLKIPKLIVLSSLAACGPSRNGPLSEEDPMHPVSMYGKSKKNMEQLIQNAADDSTSITILRPPAVYGPREDQIYTFFKMVDKRICPIIGDGVKPKISLVYVSDLIRGILKAAEQKRPGVDTYFIADKELHTWNEIRKVSTTVLGKKAIPIYIKPGFVKKIAAAVEKTASVFGSYPVINREKANEMVLEWTCSVDKAEKELGFTPKYSLAEGISRTIHWYKMHHWL